MRRIHQVRVSLAIIWLSCLPTHVVAAQPKDSPPALLRDPQAALFDADLFHEEYRQDLVQSLADSERMLANAQGDSRTQALLYKARLHRLRGEFKLARLTLQEVQRNQGSRADLHVYRLGEDMLLQLDERTLPGEALRPADRMLRCRPWLPDIDAYLAQFEAHLPSALELAREPRATAYLAKLLNGPLLLMRLRLAHSTLLQSYVLPNSAAKENAQAALTKVRSVQLSMEQPAERQVLLYSRLLMPLLTRSWLVLSANQQMSQRNWSTFLLALERDKPPPTEQHDVAEMAFMTGLCDEQRIAPVLGTLGPYMEGAVSIGCAERLRFAGSSAEELGLITEQSFDREEVHGLKLGQLFARPIGAAAVEDFAPSILERHGLSRLRTPEELAAADRWAARAATAYSRAGHVRGLARVAMSDAALKVMAATSMHDYALTLARREALESVRRQVDKSLALATLSADRRMILELRSMRIVLHALAGQKANAEDEARATAALANTQEDDGALVGVSRLLAAVAQTVSDSAHDAMAAGILFSCAVLILESDEAHVLEAARIRLLWSVALRGLGALEASSRLLVDASKVAARSCESPLVTPVKLGFQVRLLEERLVVAGQSYNARSMLAVLAELIALWDKLKACLASAGNQDEAAPAASGASPILCDATSIEAANLVGFQVLFPMMRVFIIAAAMEIQGLVQVPKEAEAARDGPHRSAARPQGRGELADLLSGLLAQEKLPANEERQRMEASYRKALGMMTSKGTLGPELLRKMEDTCDPRGNARSVQHDCVQATNTLFSYIGLRIKLFSLRHLDIERSPSRADYEEADSLMSALAERAGPDWMLQAPEPWKYLTMAATIASGLGRHAAALRWAREAITALEVRRDAINDETLRIGFLDNSTMTSYLGLAVTIAAQAGDADATVEFIERGKARILQESLLLQDDPRAKEALSYATNLKLWERIFEERGCTYKTSASCQQLAAELAELKAWFEKNAQNGYRRLGSALTGSYKLSQLASSLKDDELLLDYFVCRDALVSVAIRRGQPARVFHTPISRVKLRGSVQSLFSDLTKSLAVDERLVAELVSQLLVQQLTQHDPAGNASGARTLLIAPHAELHRVPWAYLPDPSVPGKRLVERYALRILPFAGMLGQRGQAAPLQSALAVLLLTEGLDYVAAEAAAISGQYRSAQTIPTPRISDLSQALRQDGVVHIIAHGHSSDRADLDTADDGFAILRFSRGDVRVTDLLRIPQRFCARVVVMASCSLGMSRESAGDEQLGIPSVLLAKGVGSIIASLWKLPEQSPTKDFMAWLHAEISRGKSGPEALVAVQRAAIAQRLPPVYWAGINALGW